MDILVPDSWLKDFIKTAATPRQTAKYLSLCGPSVDKVAPVGRAKKKEYVYHIEVMTNRVDSASVYGIAREAAAILPRFKIGAKFRPLKLKANQKFLPRTNYLKAQVDQNLCPRFSAILIKNVKIKPSPNWLNQRLNLVGVRPINNVVDISNYVMHEIGQPVHTFDYDKILGAKMVLRASKRGERLTTLDGKTHLLPGGDIVIEDGQGRLIDLAGIMGGKLSAVEAKTKNILLFVQTYNPAQIRRTSMSLAQRTKAAVLFEKGLDPELVSLGIRRGIDLFVELTQGRPEREILDIYPKPYKPRKITTDLGFIRERLGVAISKAEISRLLNTLGFEVGWSGKNLDLTAPSFRANDVFFGEDIVEEVARIYGYHNLPSELMQGVIPDPLPDTPFDFEQKLKNILKGWGGVEVYTLSMVTGQQAGKNALKLKNPLGTGSKYLRTTLAPSLVSAAQDNLGEDEPFHLFEVANVYLPRRSNTKAGPQLPEEKMTLAGIFTNYPFRKAKGVIEALLEELNVPVNFVAEDGPDFLPSQRLKILSKNKKIGFAGILSEGSIYYQFDTEALGKAASIQSFRPIPKYPAQIEDITLILPERTKVGEVILAIKSSSKLVKNVELGDVYKDAYTFRLWYQDPKKTLADKEVEAIRNRVLSKMKKKFGAAVKV